MIVLNFYYFSNENKIFLVWQEVQQPPLQIPLEKTECSDHNEQLPNTHTAAIHLFQGFTNKV